MVADHQARRAVAGERTAGQDPLQPLVALGKSVMGQVAGDDDPVGVALVFFHMRQAFQEIVNRIEIEDRLGTDMDVGDMDEFHRGIRIGRFAVS